MKNTIEAFKAEDKNAFIQRQGETIWSLIQSGAFWQAGLRTRIKFLKKNWLRIRFFPLRNIPEWDLI